MVIVRDSKESRFSFTLETMRDSEFRKLVLKYFEEHGRHDLPWRKAITPYKVLISEIMLQQTQVPRVIEKYKEFLRAFPTFRVLAYASTADVLKVWQGLGYNRRALMVQRCAQVVTRDYRGKIPTDVDALRALPGIGPYTAGAIMAFAFDQPVALIETNIRRVYLHHYFATRRKVADAEIFPLLTRHVAGVASARQWYSALMDYGTHLATMVVNPNRRSRQYTRQASFAGSVRQLRGRILRYVATLGTTDRALLLATMADDRTPVALDALEKEGFLRTTKDTVSLAR